MKLLDSITNSVDMNLSNLREIVKDKGAWGAAVYGIAKSQTRLSDWTTRATHTVNWTFVSFSKLQRFQEYLYYFPNCSYILTSSVINSSFVWRICELSSLALDFFHMLWNVILQAQLEGVFSPSTSFNPFLCLLTLSVYSLVCLHRALGGIQARTRSTWLMWHRRTIKNWRPNHWANR